MPFKIHESPSNRAVVEAAPASLPLPRDKNIFSEIKSDYINNPEI